MAWYGTVDVCDCGGQKVWAKAWIFFKSLIGHLSWQRRLCMSMHVHVHVHPHMHVCACVYTHVHACVTSTLTLALLCRVITSLSSLH